LSSKKIFCHNCGKENLATNKFCSACGTKLDKTAKSYSGANNGSKSISNTQLLIIMVGIVLVGIIILYFSGTFDKPNFVQHNANQQTNNQNFQNQQAGPDLNSIQEIASLEKEYDKNPKNFDTLLRLAHLLNDSRFFERAIKEYTTYLKKFPKKADVWVDMGVCYYNLKEHSKAIEIMKKAIKINPNHQIANFNLGIVNFDFGKKEEALKWWKKAVAINPNSRIGKKAQELLNQNK